MTPRPAALLLAALVVATCLAPPVRGQEGRAADLVRQGERHLAAQDPAAARSAFEAALALSAELLPARLGLAEAAVAEARWTDAADLLDGLLEELPPGDSALVAAHYLEAVTARELAKFRTLDQRRHWDRAETGFRLVLAHDSLYRDALYQSALLRLYLEEYEEAVRLGHAQLRNRPELEEAHYGLFGLYRQLVNHRRLDRALAFLEAHPSAHAVYFRGEALRKADRLAEADALFRELLDGALPFPRQPVLLSRARVLYAQGRDEPAERLVEQAIDEVAGPFDARFVFDDVKYILGAKELAQYRTLETADELRAFFRGVWTGRDPLPARTVNLRRVEHYRRLAVAERKYAYDGFRLWHSNPDRLSTLEFPAAYRLNDAFNDKGLVYIRHGEPDDWVADVSSDVDTRIQKGDLDAYWSPDDHSYAATWHPNESWRYYRPERMDFHFVRLQGDNNWRLAPEVTNFGMLENLEAWGPPYAEMAEAARAMQAIQASKMESSQQLANVAADDDAAAERLQEADSTGRPPAVNLSLVDRHSRNYLDFSYHRGRMTEAARAAVQLGLTTDRADDWKDDVEAIPMPHVVAAFRGADGRTDVEIHFALPLGAISRAAGPDVRSVPVEVGYAVHDTTWRAVAEAVNVKQMPATADETAAAIDFFRFSAPPDTVTVAFHGAPEGTSQLAGHRFGYRIPDFSRPGLAMSDVIPADFVGPARGSRYDRGEVHVSPNPFRRFSTRQPVYVYFEVYGLTFDAEDRTRYTMGLTLTSDRPRPKLLGLIPMGGGDRTVLSIEEPRTGTAATSIEYAGIDVSAVEPGPYTLTLRITDRTTDAVVERSLPIELYEAQ